METIHKVTVSRGSKSVTLYARNDDVAFLFSAALPHGIDCRAVEYTRAETPLAAWERFVLMRLALHEHHPAPRVPLHSRTSGTAYDLVIQTRAALDAILSRFRQAPPLPSGAAILGSLQNARDVVDEARTDIERPDVQ